MKYLYIRLAVILSVIFAVILVIDTSEVRAGAFGTGVSFSGGIMSVGHKSSSNMPTNTALQLGFGLIYDTALLNEKFFNNRTSLEYRNMFNDDIKAFNKYSLHMLTLTNVFGFRFYRSEIIQMWAGPFVAVSYQFQHVTKQMPLGSFSSDYDGGLFGVGAVLGINFNPNPYFFIGLEGGGRAGVGIGKGKTAGLYNKSDTSYPIMAEGFVRLSLMFRIGESSHTSMREVEKPIL